MRVLFVEDDAMNRRVVRDMLQLAGAEMIEAERAELGLAIIAEQPIDVILMDLRMPGMDGMEAIRRIRARGDARGQLPIIVITADTALDIRADCIACGADDLIMKPVAMTELFDAMGKVIVRASQRIGRAA